MAQDFYRLFNVGTDSCSISTIDTAGVALTGIQQLSTQFEQMKSASTKGKAELLNENASLKLEIEALKSRLEKIEIFLSDH